MDQSSYWITSTKQNVTERPPILSTHPSAASSYYESWEERAFAEDYSCIWPPRSYLCTFCRREFRSAQALGGHMNVHRRDRARLRSASSPTDQEASPNNDALPVAPAPVASYLYSINPNPKSDPKIRPLSLNETLLPHDSPPSLGSIPLKSNRSDRESFAVSSVNNQGIHKENSPLNSSVQLIRDLMPSKKIVGIEEFVRVKNENEPRSSKKRGLPATGESTNEDVVISKRRKVDLIGSPIVINSPSCNQERLEIGLLALHPGPDEELDLELRLGGMPKIKQVM